MPVLCQIGLILGVCLAGEALHAWIPYPIPASVYGLLILLGLLITRVVKPDQIRPTAQFLMDCMPLLFVPATVGVIESWDVLKSALVPFLLAATLITAAVMIVSGKTVQKLEGKENHDRASQ